MNYRLFLYPLLAVVAAIYPLLVYYGLSAYGPRLLAAVLFVVVVSRHLLLRGNAEKQQNVQLILVIALCLLVAVFDSEQLLKYYSVIMNLGFASFFWLSLKSEKTLIERFAGLGGRQFEAHQRNYMRGLTKVWAALLFLNGMVSFYTACCLSMKQWAIYNGLLAYGVFAIFVAIELVYRQYYKRQHAKQQN